MSIYATLFSLLAGGLVFMFIYWRALREDYDNKIIFNSAFVIFGFGIVAALLVNYISKTSGLWFWGGFLGMNLGLLLSFRASSLRYVEILEPALVAMMPLYSLFLVVLGLLFGDFPSVGFGVFVLLLFILFFVLSSNYRRISWYKSGRQGFAGMTIIGLMFFGRSLVAGYIPFMISFVGEMDVIPSAVVTFLMFFGVYNISEL